MKLNDLTGKTAIVTGAAQGLSCGMAEGLMEAGAKYVSWILIQKQKKQQNNL